MSERPLLCPDRPHIWWSPRYRPHGGATYETEDFLVEYGLATRSEAEVYVRREFQGVRRTDLADQRDVVPGTIDKQLYTVRTELKSIFACIEFFQDEGLVPVCRSDSNIWHRIDRLGCQHAGKVQGEWSTTRKLVSEDDVPDLYGEPRSDCFEV